MKKPRFVIIRIKEDTRTRLKMKAAKSQQPVYQYVDDLSYAPALTHPYGAKKNV